MRHGRAALLFLAVAVVAVSLAYQSRRPVEIAVGEAGANPFVEGFSFREQAGLGSYRWSGPAARLLFRGIGAQDGVLHLHAAAPAGAAAVSINGHALDRLRIAGPEVGSYQVPVERRWLGLAGDLVVAIESPTFTAPPDPRELGVLAVSARFEPAAGLVFPAPLAVLYVLLDAALAFIVVRAWSRSVRLAWAAAGLVVALACCGLALARLQAAWLAGVAFWLGLIGVLAAWAVVWVLRQFGPLDARGLRQVGLLCLGALAVRVPLAVRPGFVADVQDYVVWSYKLVRYGLGSAYTVIGGLWAADYPPVLLYLFKMLGSLYRSLFAPDFLYPVTAGDPALRAITDNPARLADPTHRTLLRLPATFADLATGALIWVLARRRTTGRWALAVAALYLFNPAVIYNSAQYGQTDAVHTLLVVLAFALLEAPVRGEVGRPLPAFLSFAALAVAGLTKPQAFVFAPLLVVMAFQQLRWRGMALAAGGGAAGAVLAILPMAAAGGLPGLLSHLAGTVGYHPVLSANAHNFWWFVTRGVVGIKDTTALLGRLDYRTMGLLLFACAYGLALARLWRHRASNLWALGAYVGFAFFMLPTEIHENYAFAVLALLAVALAEERRLLLLYIPLSLTMAANYALHDPDVYRLFHLAAPDAQLATARWAISALNLLVFVLWTAWLVRGLVARPSVARPPAEAAA